MIKISGKNKTHSVTLAESIWRAVVDIKEAPRVIKCNQNEFKDVCKAVGAVYLEDDVFSSNYGLIRIIVETKT